jgi:hypothetical protein
MVLLMIAITLALSYALVRSQGTATLLADNSLLDARARQAALSGMALAVMNLHEAARWSGADTTLSRNLSSTERFEVRFETGDSSLASDDADWPYRLTIVSTGIARDPVDANRQASHEERSVVRLVPRELAPEPANWTEDVLNYTLYQTAWGTVSIDPPARIEGRVRLQGTLHLGCGYAWSWAAKSKYFTDLNAMRSSTPPASGPSWLLLDYRPFNGPVTLAYGAQEWGLVSLLNDPWNAAATDMDVKTYNADVVTRSLASTYETDGYKLYTGGRTYSGAAIGSTQAGVNLQPSPRSNPLGLFYRQGDLELRDGVAVRGALVAWSDSSADLVVSGRNVNLESLDLPALVGSDGCAGPPVRLPVVASTGDITLAPGSQSVMRGLVAAIDRFEVDGDDQADMGLALEGKLIAREIVIQERNDWDKSEDWWNSHWTNYNALPAAERSVKPFPVWLLAQHKLDYRPQLGIKPDAQPARYFWPTTAGPVYVPHSDDDGLRWDVLVPW